MSGTLNIEARKGRGAVSNASGRFEGERRAWSDDGWGRVEDDPTPLRTEVTIDSTRTILAHNKSPDIPFDRSINPYRGCEHGCVYCFARPTHAFLGLSPGLDFESKLFAKPNAAELLRTELAKPSYRCKPVAIGTNTDPYQPIEREYRITRSILELLLDCKHPVSIVTKSALVQRDLDILKPLAERNLVRVFLSITTLDRRLARAMEPRASSPARRLGAIRALAEAGVPTGVMTAPIIPGLNDHELESILDSAKAAGASSAGYILIRLPLEIKDLFAEWLEVRYPSRAKRVLSLIRQTRGGSLYRDKWGERMKGTGAVADLIAKRFSLAVLRLDLDRNDWHLDTKRFRPPAKDVDQLTLF